jgi:hypothetical protein
MCVTGFDPGDALRLRRQVGDRDVHPFVDDGFAEDAHAELGRARQKRLHVLELEPQIRDIAEPDPVVPQQRVVLRGLRRRQQEVRELGRRKRFAGGELDATAVAFEHALFVVDAARLVEQQVGVLRSLHVDVGMEGPDGRERAGLRHDRDVVDDLESRHLPRAVFLSEADRSFLGDVPIGRNRHDQDIAERASFFEMNEVADVDQVERAVALHDRLAAVPLADLRQRVERHDLLLVVPAIVRSSRCRAHTAPVVGPN